MDIQQHLSELQKEREALSLATTALINDDANIKLVIKANEKRLKLMDEQIEQMKALAPKPEEK